MSLRMSIPSVVFAILLLPLCLFGPASAQNDETNMKCESVVFATYAENPEALDNICQLTESLRTFGGRLSSAPVWVYVPEDLATKVLADIAVVNKLKASGVEIRASVTPDDCKWFFYGGKPAAAAAQAEADVLDKKALLVWLDDDTVFLTEPAELLLDSAHSFGYRPVMHNRSGTLYEEPPIPFWARIYEKLSVPAERLFPMVSVADKQKIRAYFNCGLMAFRPEKRIINRWAKDFLLACRDSVLAQMCRENPTWRVFLHQAALVGAVLNTIPQSELIELSSRYNYPVFFHKQYAATELYNKIDDIVTLRTEVILNNGGAEWYRELIGSPEKIEWLRSHLSQPGSPR